MLKQFLRQTLTGGVHTQERMCRAGLPQIDFKEFSFCGFDHDKSATVLTCPVFEPVRPPARPVVLDCLDHNKDLLPCELLSGTFLQDPELLSYFKERVLEAEPKPLPNPPPAKEYKDKLETGWVEGNGEGMGGCSRWSVPRGTSRRLPLKCGTVT